MKTKKTKKKFKLPYGIAINRHNRTLIFDTSYYGTTAKIFKKSDALKALNNQIEFINVYDNYGTVNYFMLSPYEILKRDDGIQIGCEFFNKNEVSQIRRALKSIK